MNHLFIVRDHLIAGIDFLSELNCDVENIGVFDYAATEDEHPYAVVISHLFSDEASEAGNFGSEVFEWRVLVNFFAALRGNKQEEKDSIQDGYLKVREIIDYFTSDFTLSQKVLDCRVHAVTTPETYNRNTRDEYFMIGIVLIVKEFLHG